VRRARQLHFDLAGVGQRIDGLTVQIAGIQGIGVHQAQMADARAGQVLEHGTAESADADDQYPAARQSRLTLAPISLRSCCRE